MDSIEIQQIYFYIRRNDIDELENYIKENHLDITIVKEYISENNYSSYLNETLISSIKNYKPIKKIEFLLSLFKNPPNNEALTIAIRNNNYDIADILIDHNVIIPSDIINKLYKENNLNFYNLKYIVNNGYKNNFKKSNIIDQDTNNSLISQWIKSINNKFLEIFLKYINYSNNIFEIKNKRYIEALLNENYDGFIILFDNDNRNINNILGYIINTFECDKNGVPVGKNYNNFINYLDSDAIPFKDRDFYCNGRYDTEDKTKYVFIDEKKYKSIKTKIKANIEKYLETINNITNLLKKNKNIQKFEFENYLNENIIDLTNLKTEYFDILIFAIENEASENTIEYIINKFSYDNMNYGNKKIANSSFTHEFNKIRTQNYSNFQRVRKNQNLRNHYKNKTINFDIDNHIYLFEETVSYTETPLYVALSKNRFKIADILIEKGADIISDDIIYALYLEELLNCENLKYILDNNYHISEKSNNIILNWIKSFDNNFLEIYLCHLNNEKYENFVRHNKIVNTINYNALSKVSNKFFIRNEYYHLSFYCKNYNAILILYDNDIKKEDKSDSNNNDDEVDDVDDTLYKIFLLSLKNNEEKIKGFMKYITNNNIKFEDENFYNSNKKENDVDERNVVKNNYITKKKYIQLKNNIRKTFSKLDIISKRSITDIKKKMIKLIKNNKNNIWKFKNYIQSNYVNINELSYENDDGSFDILIFLIQKNPSLELLEYIISLYKNLNYSLSSMKNVSDEYYKFRRNLVNSNYNSEVSFDLQFTWNCPLFSAIAENKFQISDILINHGANINYDRNIINYLNEENRLNIKNLKYIISHGFLPDKIKNDDIINRIKTITYKLINNYSYLRDNYQIEKNDNFSFINKWIKSNKNKFLEIYLKYLTTDDNIIKREFYESAIRNDNYNALVILFDNDDRDKNEIVYEIIEYIFWIDNNKLYNDDNNYDDPILQSTIREDINDIDKNYKEGKKYKTFFNKIKNNELNFNNEDFYYEESTAEEKNNKIFIDTEKYNKIITDINNISIMINKSLEKRFKIIEILENIEKSEFEKYIKNKENNIHLQSINVFNFDLLIYAIEHDIDDELIKLIIELQYEELCQNSENEKNSLDYYIIAHNKSNNRNNNYDENILYKVPLFCAIENNKFYIADLLLKYGCNINYSIKYKNGKNNSNKTYDIMEYLYQKKYFSSDYSDYGLMYLLSNGYIINNEDIISNLIQQFIENDKTYDGKLEIFLKFPTKKFKKISIKDKYYEMAIEERKNYHLYILYDNDEREKNKIFFNIHKEYENKSKSDDSYWSSHISFQSFLLIDTISSFKNNNLYYFFNNNLSTQLYGKCKFLNKNKFLKIKKEFQQRINNITTIKDNVKDNLDENKNEFTKFKDYINENKIDLKTINSYSFDILIYSINNDASKEIIKYIIDQYDNETLNYFIESYNDESRYCNDKNPNQYSTPLLTAIEKNRLDIADLILSHPKTDINFEPNDSVPSFIYCKNFLDDKKLKYLLCKGYNLPKNLIKYCIFDIYCKEKEKYLRIIYNHYYFDNNFIINLLNSYKNKIPISNKYLHTYISNEKNKVINDDIYDFLITNGNIKLLNQIIKYEYDSDKKYSISLKFFRKLPLNYFSSKDENTYFRNGKFIKDPFKNYETLKNSNNNHNSHDDINNIQYNIFTNSRRNNNQYDNNYNNYNEDYNNYDDYSVYDDDDYY